MEIALNSNSDEQIIRFIEFVTDFHSSSLFFIFLLKVFAIFLQEKRVYEVLTTQTLDYDAPQAGLFSNQFWDELRVYATLNYLIIKVVDNREVGLILVVLAIL